MDPNPVLTFLIEYENKFLLIKRSKKESNFPDLWAFPGEKVNPGETLVDTIKRGVKEETGLSIHNEFDFLDSYSFKTSTGRYSVGLAVIVRAENDKVIPNKNELNFYKWISNRDEILDLNRIPGIDNHLVAARKVLERGFDYDLERFNLTENKYLNN